MNSTSETAPISVETALELVRQRLPFTDYNAHNSAAYRTVGTTVQKYLPRGGRIYDFGAGPCDKTAVLAFMGYDCTAYDDLRDNWHLIDNNREKILDFAAKSGIVFRTEFEPMAEGPFDMVLMNDVLEHLHESPRSLLTTLVAALRENGYLFVTVPNLANLRKRFALLRGKTNLPSYDLYFTYEGFWRGPVREYVRGDLETMTYRTGLEMVELRTAHHMLYNLSSNLTRAVYLSVVRFFPDCADTWVLVARKPAGWIEPVIE